MQLTYDWFITGLYAYEFIIAVVSRTYIPSRPDLMGGPHLVCSMVKYGKGMELSNGIIKWFAVLEYVTNDLSSINRSFLWYFFDRQSMLRRESVLAAGWTWIKSPSQSGRVGVWWFFSLPLRDGDGSYMYTCPLVNSHTANWKITMLFIGKSTISMGRFQ